jgi:hypothetical protein
MGFEPTLDNAITTESRSSCENCLSVHAALALHGGSSNCLSLASIDADLNEVLAAWEQLPQAIRAAIMALVGSVPAALSADVLPNRSHAARLDEAAWRIARDCRNAIQGCLREEEWQDADREFHRVILQGIKVPWLG